jgi:S-DNA-T family DNA segregation ATPase FtsK/SpoIIIE
MRLQLTVVVSGREGSPQRRPIEVEVEAPVGATVDQLASALAATLSGSPHPDRAMIWVAGRQVRGAAPVGTAPLVDGVALTLTLDASTTRPGHATHARAPVALAIAHGPDAGRTIELVQGEHTLGRGTEASITLADRRLSRLHALITVTTDSITVADLESTNGTELDGTPVDVRPRPVRVGAARRVGDSRLTRRAAGEPPAAQTPRGDGTITRNRRPPRHHPTAPPTIAFPTPPSEVPRPRVPWVAMLFPLPVAAVMALAFGPTMLAVAVMSPLLMAGTVMGDRLTSKRRYSADHATYLRRLRRAEEGVAAACAEESHRLRLMLPDPAQTLLIATTPTARVWERPRTGVDALTASIGWSTKQAAVRVVRSVGADPEHPLLERVPCAIALADAGVTGFCGERSAVLGVLHGVLGQLVTLHSPLDLELVLVSGPGRADEAWSWLGRLPHVRRSDGRARDGWVLGLDQPGRARAGVAALASVVRQRVADQRERAREWSGPRTLVVLDGTAALRGLPGLAEVLDHGPSVGICVAAVSDDQSGLPSQARAVLDLSDPARPELRTPGAVPAQLVVDHVGAWWTERLSRGLAPLRDGSPGMAASELPETVGLRTLLALGDPGTMAATLASRWAVEACTTSIAIGCTEAGPFRVDLASDGPHVLVAGTTGAGKSELLRTLVASLAVHNRPEDLSMVLIDYKGGAAFRECAPLPHVAAVVTDLDDHLAARALITLRAELTRREHLLAAAGAADFVAYQSSPTAGAALHRLVIVIDEFRALAEQIPDFVDGMVAVAALGRSLGVHLVLATQRPAGVVTADMKANLNLRIGLRLRDRADSLDVLDTPEAAAVDPRTPGRSLARVGGGPVTVFQAAHAGATTRPREPADLRVRQLPWGGVPAPWPAPPDDGDSTSDLSVVVAAVSAAAAATCAQPAPSPWLPPLADQVEVQSLPPASGPRRSPIGLVDEPAQQRQRPLEVSLDEPGHWGFLGGPGSGRTTALLAFADATTATAGPSDLHLYAVSGGSLSAVQSLPHCGAHVGIDDSPRLERLVARLSEELARRRRQLAAAGHASMGDWRREEPTTTPAAVLVLVDDWDLLVQRADDHHGGAAAIRLLGVLREGSGLGLTAVLAGGRSLLAGAAASTLTHRVLLRTDDPTDCLLAGLPPRSAPAHQPPGRGLLRDGSEVQLALPRSLNGGSRGRDRAHVAGGPTSERMDQRPWRVDALPQRVDVDCLPTPPRAEDLLLLGLGGDELGPRGLSPRRDGPQWAVVGGAGSGVSTTLATVATGLLSQGRRLCVVGARSTAWAELRQDARLLRCDDPAQVAELVALRREAPDLAVVVDDAEQLLDTPMDATLREVAALAERDGGLVVVGVTAEALSVQYRGLAVAVARHRTGVLLGPTTTTAAEAFGVRVPVDRAAGPGRGHLVRSGVTVPIQVASTTVR